MLELKNVTKKYGDKIALDALNISFDIGVYGLLGSNGAGKSTMLNLITDNIKRTSGEILFDGTEILKLGKKYRKQLGYTPQLQGMYDDFTAREFLYYIGSLKGMKSKDCKKQTMTFLDIVSLSDSADFKLHSFSGGMKQRVLLAAAMLDEPRLLILDEPTVGLDPTQRIRLRDYIASISKDRTILLATHVISDIESIADKVLILSHGQCIRFDSPNRLVQEIAPHCQKERPDLEDVYLYYAKGALNE